MSISWNPLARTATSLAANDLLGEHDTTHILSVKWLNSALGNCAKIESTDLRQGRGICDLKIYRLVGFLKIYVRNGLFL